VTVLVVDLLEKIDICQHAHERSGLARPTLDLLRQAALEKTPVGNAGKRIGESIELETLMIDRIVDAQRRHGRQVLEQVRRYTGHEMLRITAALIEAADQFAAANKRRNRHRS